MNTRTRTLALYGTLTATIAAGGGLAYGALNPSQSASATTATRLVSAERGVVSTTVAATGTVAPATSLDLAFDSGGTLAAVHVAAGDRVTAGQTLAEIDATQAEIDLKVAKANLLSAQHKLTEARAGISTAQQAQNDAALAGAQQKVDSASRTLAQAEQAAASSGSEQDHQAVAQARAALLQAEADLAETKAANAAAADVDPVAVAQAEANLDQAELNVQRAEEALKATVLTAPVAGTLTAVNYQPGDQVAGAGTSASSSTASSTGAGGTAGSGGAAFATLVDLTEMVIEVGFPETDASDVTAGQSATVTIDSLPDIEIDAAIAQIDTLSTVVSNVVTYNAVIALDEIPAGVKAGMTANVTVVTASKDNVISVPSAAIQTSGGQSTVTVMDGGVEATRAVGVGLKGDGATEIISGLTEGDQVVMSVGVVSGAGSADQTQTQPGGGFGGGGPGGFGGGGGFPGGR